MVYWISLVDLKLPSLLLPLRCHSPVMGKQMDMRLDLEGMLGHVPQGKE